jgi:hypothetical protein
MHYLSFTVRKIAVVDTEGVCKGIFQCHNPKKQVTQGNQHLLTDTHTITFTLMIKISHNLYFC